MATDAEAIQLIGKQDIGRELYEKMSTEYFPHYALYHKEGNHQRAYCTHCREHFSIFRNLSDAYTERTVALGTLVHGEKNTCPLCGSLVMALADGKGRRKIEDKRNFVIFKAISETELSARAVRITRRFAHPEAGRYFTEVDSQIFEFWDSEVARYYFHKGEDPLKFVKKFESRDGGSFTWDWKRIKKVAEPEFVHSMYFYDDNSYTVIDEDEIYDTCFGYIIKAADSVQHPMKRQGHEYKFQNRMLTLLGKYCMHPQIEYMMKAGYADMVDSWMFSTGMAGLRLNWKSNDLKKVLAMNTQEIKLLANTDTILIAHYKHIRKIDKKSTEAEIVELLKKTHSNSYTYYHFVQNMIENCGESCTSILKYIDHDVLKLYDWADYHRQCRELGYDLAEKSVFKPKHLDVAHERLTRIIQVKADKENEKRMKKRQKSLSLYAFTDEEHNLVVRAAASTQEIIDEGKNLVHCVGGYADRHAKGELTIVFVRNADEPDKSFYTMEVSKQFRIVQCRGYKNNRETPKPQYITDFEKMYQEHLDKQYRKLKSAEARKEKLKKQRKAKKEKITA